MVWADSGPFPCVVQCKGLKKQLIDRTNIADMEESIRKFSASDATADTYILLHNRDGSNREVPLRLEPLLRGLEATGKARRALLWDRQHLLKECFTRMQHLVEQALLLHSAEAAAHFVSLFRFASCHVAEVPVSERSVILRRGAAVDLGPLDGPRGRNPAALLEAASGNSWLVLSGDFGTGKTTAALAAASQSGRPTVFVSCQAIPASVFKGGMTTELVKCVIPSLPLLDALSANDRESLSKMAAGLVSHVLRKPDGSYLFILDGLDEHHELGALAGLQRLSNQLADFKCPVVLTTRRAHLDAMFGDFSLVLGDLGAKGGARESKVLYLEPWNTREVTLVARAAIAATTGIERERMGAFLADVEAERQPYGDLVFHPLFLQFILESVADGERGVTNRPTLIQSWVERKIRRDRASAVPNAVANRAQVVDGMDTAEVVERVCIAMGTVAAEMTIVPDSEIQLTETIAAGRVMDLVRDAFGGVSVELLPLLLNSVLTTVGPRLGMRVDLGFSLRALQEYFVADFLRRRGQTPDRWPRGVKLLYDEMKAAEINAR